MAALQSIRSKGKLIAICVGGALLAFVLGDFINSGATIFGASQTKIAKINGTSIDYNDFQYQVQAREDYYKALYNRSTLDAQTTDAIRQEVWADVVNQNTIGKYIENQGIRVSDKELATRLQIGDVSPLIRQIVVSNSQTGAYDPSIAQSIAQSPLWGPMESDWRKQCAISKYANMVAGGLYVTTAEVEHEFAGRTRIADIRYVAVPLSDVKDEEVSPTDADIKAYYDTHKNRFFSATESRDVNYVSFDVIPSKEDSAEVLAVVDKIKDGFVNAPADGVEGYVNSNSDIPYLDYHYSKGDIQNDIVDSLMFSEQPGFVYGPYVEGEYYKMARLISTEQLCDSVKASHILILAQNDTVAAKAKADSILNVINSGIDFGAMASQFSEDQGSAKDSGNLGWITERTPFIPEFKTACFSTEKGKCTIVKTQYGYHIIKVFDKTAPKKKVSVGFMSIEIRPSDETRSQAYNAASSFSGSTRKPAEFQNAAQTQNYHVLVAPGLTAETNQIPGLDNSRSLVQWAFNDEKNQEVSDVMEFGDRYVVAVLAAVHPKGVPELGAVKDYISREVVKELKADKIAAQMQGQSVDAAAAKFSKPVQEASSVNFEMYQIPGIGVEPAVIAAASALEANQTSAPIKGHNGVYVIQNVSLTPAQAIQPLNITTDRRQMENEIRYRIVNTNQLNDAIMQMSDIDDRRVKFF